MSLVLSLIAGILVGFVVRTLLFHDAARRERDKLLELEKSSRASVRQQHEARRIDTVAFEVNGGLAEQLQRSEWIRIGYDEYRKDHFASDCPGGPELIPFDAWVLETAQEQEYESWRRYFAKVERERGQSLAELSVALWHQVTYDPEIVKAGVAWEDQNAKRPSHVRSFLDIDIRQMAYSSWLYKSSPIYHILHPDIPRSSGWDGRAGAHE